MRLKLNLKGCSPFLFGVKLTEHLTVVLTAKGNSLYVYQVYLFTQDQVGLDEV